MSELDPRTGHGHGAHVALNAGARPQTVGHAIRQYAARVSLSATGGLTVITYVVLRIAASNFYARFGVSPEDVGIGQPELLARSAGIAVLALLVTVLMAVIFALLDELVRLIRRHDPWARTNAPKHPAPSESSHAAPALPGPAIWLPSPELRWERRAAERAVRNRRITWIIVAGAVLATTVLNTVSRAAGNVATIALGWAVMLGIVLRSLMRVWRMPTRGTAVLLGFATPFALSMGLVIAFLVVVASSDAGIVLRGNGISDWTVPWDAKVVTVESAGPGALPANIAGMPCGIYLGSSAGKAIIVDPITHETLWIPTDKVILRSYLSSGAAEPTCTRKGVTHVELR